MNKTITHADAKFHRGQKVKLNHTLFKETAKVIERYYSIDNEKYLYKVQLSETNEDLYIEEVNLDEIQI